METMAGTQDSFFNHCFPTKLLKLLPSLTNLTPSDSHTIWLSDTDLHELKSDGYRMFTQIHPAYSIILWAIKWSTGRQLNCRYAGVWNSIGLFIHLKKRYKSFSPNILLIFRLKPFWKLILWNVAKSVSGSWFLRLLPELIHNGFIKDYGFLIFLF